MIKTLKERLESDYLVGCIKCNYDYQFYLMPVAWWILDYARYDPSILREDPFNFRNGVYTVSDDRIEEYLHTISTDRISLAEFRYITDTFTEEYSRLTFFYQL